MRDFGSGFISGAATVAIIMGFFYTRLHAMYNNVTRMLSSKERQIIDLEHKLSAATKHIIPRKP